MYYAGQAAQPLAGTYFLALLRGVFGLSSPQYCGAIIRSLTSNIYIITNHSMCQTEFGLPPQARRKQLSLLRYFLRVPRVQGFLTPTSEMRRDQACLGMAIERRRCKVSLQVSLVQLNTSHDRVRCL